MYPYLKYPGTFQVGNRTVGHLFLYLTVGSGRFHGPPGAVWERQALDRGEGGTGPSVPAYGPPSKPIIHHHDNGCHQRAVHSLQQRGEQALLQRVVSADGRVSGHVAQRPDRLLAHLLVRRAQQGDQHRHCSRLHHTARLNRRAGRHVGQRPCRLELRATRLVSAQLMSRREDTSGGASRHDRAVGAASAGLAKSNGKQT